MKIISSRNSWVDDNAGTSSKQTDVDDVPGDFELVLIKVQKAYESDHERSEQDARNTPASA